ncbi:hypothetical protein [Citreimonas salinaria]|uniref:Uncharacterized protein n=1 Tax=Citreimonas salinaria TaxID=321339 RepID=A0A1H3H6F2_9RHOB|nr:hypothetical protein [Citreimonas salinaria]SDY10488.1 hypothetical protein SAMN05444340_103231 [Citreimonas salinaria]
MPSKIFTYVEDGLSYTVTVTESVDDQGNPTFHADITVDEGAMDLNAIYFGDDTFAGDSAGLKGPLNMNGAGAQLDGESVQWDDAVKLSDPGLRSDGTDKDTYLTAGETFRVENLDITSLDDIDIFGVRATSTTTESGSIKGVSGEEPEDPVDPDEPTYDKVFFGSFDDTNDMPESGTFLFAEGPEIDERVLPEGTEPTFANYLSYYETELGGNVKTIEGVAFYQFDAENTPQEVFRIEAGEDGFADSEELLAAYDAALDAMEAEGTSLDGMDLMAALSLPEEDDDGDADEVEEDAEDAELV